MSLLSAASGGSVSDALADRRDSSLSVPCPAAVSEGGASSGDMLSVFSMMLCCLAVFLRSPDLSALSALLCVAAWVNRGPAFKYLSWMLSAGLAVGTLVTIKTNQSALALAAASAASAGK